MDFDFETQIPTELKRVTITLRYFVDDDGEEHKITRFQTEYADQHGKEIENSPRGDYEPHMTTGDKERAEQLLNKAIATAEKPLKK